MRFVSLRFVSFIIRIYEIDHANYICFDSPKGPIALSLIEDKKDSNEEYKILYRHDQGSERIVIPARNIVVPWYRRLFGLGPGLSDIVDGVIDQAVVKHLTLCKIPELPTELLTNEERQVRKDDSYLKFNSNSF